MTAPTRDLGRCYGGTADGRSCRRAIKLPSLAANKDKRFPYPDMFCHLHKEQAA